MAEVYDASVKLAVKILEIMGYALQLDVRVNKLIIEIAKLLLLFCN